MVWTVNEHKRLTLYRPAKQSWLLSCCSQMCPSSSSLRPSLCPEILNVCNSKEAEMGLFIVWNHSLKTETSPLLGRWLYVFRFSDYSDCLKTGHPNTTNHKKSDIFVSGYWMGFYHPISGLVFKCFASLDHNQIGSLQMFKSWVEFFFWPCSHQGQ
jgi:hypothetical protein